MHIDAPFELVLFGGLGDLALRKLMPALFLLHRDGRLPDGVIYAVTRRDIPRDAFVAKIESSIKSHVPSNYLEKEPVESFLEKVQCFTLDVNESKGYKALAKALSSDDINRLFYMATGSDLYTPICRGLHDADLIKSQSKIVLEKPIGHDLETAEIINQTVAEFFAEKQIYRIDHYLGKETVQNLMVLRFANSLFESQWNQHYIDHIQITISEQLGVEQRAEFYEHVGAMRDMFQNHLLQLLCITAMEPPAKLEPDAVRDEKVKVLKALKPITGEMINENVVRGQYDSGVADGKPVPRYRDEPGVHDKSLTETFIAAKVEIDNWRWAGVPFYLRTGKRLAERACEIVVQFKEIPHSIFPLQHKNTMANKLIFRLQPDEGVRLMLCEKRVGPGMNVRPMNLSLNPSNQRQTRVPEAYERLLYDALSGNATLFLRDDELIEAWRWVDPIIKFWQEQEQRPEPYTAGTWGPAAATLLLARDGRLWDENS
ncbi:glucose-6-phosphate dehydrogenase [Thalassolituus sp.]|jgi:glucose-6-phosphate 1-dehydrogenase|uniref:glucose-6-phosphate dehydrogenase n=1 Tax=Thalassolituus sp. TaxID=2030822 RepID=UPI00243FB100|nr:glucose-6-phosphate dehydrogenase [Pseudomonadota bacterium]